MTNKKENTRQLVECIKSGNPEGFNKLLENNKPFKSHFHLTYKNQSLIYIAIRAGNKNEVMKEVIENMAIKLIEIIKVFNKEHLDSVYSYGSLLHSATRYNYLHVIQALIGAGANLNLQNRHKQTPLHIAAKYICYDMVTKSDEQIAFHIAFKHRKYDIVKKLIDAGTNLNLQDQYGQTVLDIAYKCRNLSIVKLLQEAEEKRKTSAPVYQTQLIDLPTNNEDTSSVIASNNLLTKVIQENIIDNQISEKVCCNIGTQDNSKLDSSFPLDIYTQNNLKLNSRFTPIEEKQQASSSNISNNLCSAIDAASMEKLYDIITFISEELDDNTSSTININNKRPHSNIDTQNNSKLNSLNYNANKRTDTQTVEPSTSLNGVDTKAKKQRNDTDLIIAMSF